MTIAPSLVSASSDTHFSPPFTATGVLSLLRCRSDHIKSGLWWLPRALREDCPLGNIFWGWDCMWVILGGGGPSGQTPVRKEAGFHKWKKLNRSHGVWSWMTFRVVWNCNKEALYSSINSLTMGHPQREAPPSGRRQCPAMSHQQPTLPADRGMRTLVLRDVWWCPTASPVRMKFKLLVVTQETLMAWVLPTLISYTPFFLWVCVFLNTDALLPSPRL